MGDKDEFKGIKAIATQRLAQLMKGDRIIEPAPLPIGAGSIIRSGLATNRCCNIKSVMILLIQEVKQIPTTNRHTSADTLDRGLE